MSDICALSELRVAECACRVHAPTPARRTLLELNAVRTAVFTARFDSDCDGCGARIREGDSIARTVDADDLCEECQ